jgi:hypothetical protein
MTPQQSKEFNMKTEEKRLELRGRKEIERKRNSKKKLRKRVSNSRQIKHSPVSQHECINIMQLTLAYLITMYIITVYLPI